MQWGRLHCLGGEDALRWDATVVTVVGAPKLSARVDGAAEKITVWEVATTMFWMVALSGGRFLTRWLCG